MADRQPPTMSQFADDENFAYYWSWLHRQHPDGELYRVITTTPGLPDQTWMVEDVEKAARQLLRSRVDHLKEIVEGYEMTDRGMNRETAVQVFNEFTAGCRTLEDFETRNFSKNNRAQTREQISRYITPSPMLSKASLAELWQKGILPATPTIYSAQSEEFFSQEASNMYYTMIFGDSRVFHKIIKENSRNPNMPPPRVHPMPYNPEFHQSRNFAQFAPPYQWRPQFASPQTMQQQHVPPMQQQYQMPPRGVQQMQMPPMNFPHPPPGFQQMQPGFMPMQPYVPMGVPMAAMGGMAMQMQGQATPPQDSQFNGQSYQPPMNGNGNASGGNNNNNRGPQRGQSNNRKGGRGGRVEQQARNTQGYENMTNSSSSSSSAGNNARSSASEEEVPPLELPQNVEEVYPALNGQESTVEVEVEIAAPSAAPIAPTEIVVPAVRKFSDVVSSSVTVTSTSSEDSAPPPPSPTSPIAEMPAPVAPVIEEPAAATTELVVDTAEQDIPIVPPVSQRTVAEVLQQSLATVPALSPAPTVAAPVLMNGTASKQASPAVKAYAAVVSPANGARASQPIGGPREKTVRKQPSVSYAQMLYTTPRTASSTASTASSSGSSSQPTTSSGSSSAPRAPTDWQTVRPKKAAEPIVVAPVVHVPEAVRPANVKAPKPAEPVVSVSDDDDEDVHSDDEDAEKKRQRRRNKRQKQKEASRLQKLNEKEIARQESLARVDAMNGDAPRPPTPPPAFDRNNLAARRRKRLELQRKNEQSEPAPAPAPVAPTPPVLSTPPIMPVPIIAAGSPMSASIAAGQTALYGIHGGGQFRHRSSPFAIIGPNGSATIPLYLPPQDHEIEESPKVQEIPKKPEPFVHLTRSSRDPRFKETEIDENARMIERLLMFDSLQKISVLEMPESDRLLIAKGLEDIKKMYVRVEKAGKLICFKAGSSKVAQKVEDRLLTLTIKLLSNRVDLSYNDDQTVHDISVKISEASGDFNYTNFLSALLEFSQQRAKQLPEGTTLRKNYEQTVVLTKVFLKRTKTIYEKLQKYHDLGSLDPEQ
ncbi:unnamed protein product [Caenorhabditis sp. 36 PRJEB53466]|nr:unnamed protein product [Caenorhabditis sp. 36 PRJEB53466]